MKMTALAWALAFMVTAAAASAFEPAQRCEAAKNKIAGKYAFCRLNAESRAIKTGDPVDYSKCDSRFALKWTQTENHGGGLCPTTGDQTDIRNRIAGDANRIALKLTGVRFVDNGDGTVTDIKTGLMWEKKDDLGGVHDLNNVYSWSVTGMLPDGTAFTTFLGTLNGGTSLDASTIQGCFADHCDWRLPTIAELQEILVAPFLTCPVVPCIDPAFGPTSTFTSYWSSTLRSEVYVWEVYFGDGFVGFNTKTGTGHTRAVRAGS